jgi:hypothetical protein
VIVAEHSTPRLSDHARQRCAEMGVATKRAKRVLQDPVVVLPAGLGHPEHYRRATGEDPEIFIVFDPTPEVPVIVTVQWRTYDDYDRSRDGNGFPGRAPGFEDL